MHRRFTALLALVIAVSAACSPSGPGPTNSPGPTNDPAGIELARADVPRAATLPADAPAAAAALNAFGADLYRRLGVDGGNLVFSPASVAFALAMARAGARGETATEMDTVLHAASLEQLTSGLNALDLALAGRSGTFNDRADKPHDVTLRIANSPFAQRGMALEPAYLETLAGSFGAGLRLVDYAHDPEAARKLINAWVDARTEQRIPELLAAGTIDDLTRLVLVNAIYLKAAWATPFEPSLTKPGAFTRADGSTIDVPMMHSGGSLPYAEGAGWRAVELPYIGGSLAMTVIVPDDMAAFAAGLGTESLAWSDPFTPIVSALQAREVELALPRFGLETQADLSTILAALGMPRAFDPDTADFSGITAAEQLYISAVIHQANIDVDEKGTEAAAATAVVMGTTSVPVEAPVTMRVDRPFIFLLRDVPTGAVVFMGRVVDPAATR
jgi:serpin B